MCLEHFEAERPGLHDPNMTQLATAPIAGTAASDDQSAVAPRFAFVLVSRRFVHARNVLTHLLRQSALQDVELVLVVESRETFGADEALLARFTHCVVVEHGPIHSIAAAMAHGFRAARAPLVMYGEDHAFPDPAYAARAIARAPEPWTAIGPAMCNANPTLPLSWAMLLTSYSDWVEAVRGGPSQDIPGHDSCYRRDALCALGEDLPRLLQPMGGLHRRLGAAGALLEVDPALRVFHVNPTLVTAALSHRLETGMVNTAVRAATEHWSVGRRLSEVVLLPVNWARRCRWGLRAWMRVRATHVRSTGKDGISSPLGVWWIVVAAGCVAIGMAIGAVAGDRGRRRTLAEFELDRDRWRSPRDRHTVVA